MTVSTQVSRNEYTGNGATTQYDFTFRILDKSHLLVQTLDTSESIVTLTLGTDYTVTGVNRYNGGKVVLTSALPAGYKISIERSTPVTQEASIRNQGGFFPEIHEDAFDKLTMLVQQAYGWWSGLSLRKPSWLANYYDALNNRIRNLRDPSLAQDAATKSYVDSSDIDLQQQITSNFNRSLRVPDSYISQLPSAQDRAWKGLGFDGAGQPKLQDPAGTGLWGYVPAIGSFEQGSLLTQRFEVLLWESTDEYWRWDGAMPKIVLPGSTPDTAGGRGKGKWLDVTDATLRSNLVSDELGAASVNYIHVFNVPTRPFTYYLAKNSGDVMLAIREAAASGETIIFESGKTYDIDENDIPFAQRTGFIGPEGSYVNFNITNPAGTYGTFDLRTSNSLGGGRFNRFRNLRFRYPNQIKTINGTNTAPIVYPPLFHGGAFESRFECLDIGNAYYAFRIGGVVNSIDSGTASRVVFDQIIGAPIYIGLALTQVRDVPVIQNIRWNYNYLDGSTSEYAYDTTLKQWMHDNAVAFRFGRIDWATIINLFAYGYLYTFFEQAWGYTGSADRLKFIGCTADHSVYPVYLQNFSNRATFVACGFTGDYRSEFTRIAPNIIYINDVGDSNAIVSFTDCTFNNFSGSVIRTNGTRVELNGGRIWDFGYDSTSSLVRNAVELTASSILKISDTKIDASAGSYTRCVFDGGYGNSELYLSGTAELVGATYESYRWNGGTDGGNKEYIERGVKIEGFTTSVNCRGVISFYTQKHIYPGISMPTSGAYQSGDEVKNMTLTIQGVAGSRYVIKGWLRVTTGSSHVLNTDWVAIKQLTGD
ncbi:TPA: hypothetical protein MEH91_000118 [Klebsiella quasipneumoniae subsp. similipneumoniae]|uniref:phage tail fiber domain-containing protein n=1 Tax=Klebsiella quasipneumoniae TaxID=1463165 RepID=UPI002858DAA6|nr:hypothetical protein [Klebsiella quasipneumoniae subsp. similipneumoniae]HCM7377214.1 hypothetical protein [Klebsiella quasipneumoniae]HBW1528827.1 hypothetical protein [Klebsiella quasipneumoniae subsp. similipneumoniae]HBW1620762.1 hypothetical protein [Klebsiella quasipneumoniae subsp. similipneumoniae]HBW1704371.1 hypothetical protein [Klebsiella quasipneumoniae subsp. similipneumoniae]